MNWIKAMIPSLIPSPVYGWALLIVFALGAAGAATAVWTVRGWQMDAAVNKLKSDWQEEKRRQAEAITQSTQAARKAEAKARELANQIEVTHHEAAQTTERLLADNRRLARLAGGLRDPGARPGCGHLPGAATATGDPAHPAAESGFPETRGGLLSAEASDFILDLAAEADRAAAYAGACHEWAMSGRR